MNKQVSLILLLTFIFSSLHAQNLKKKDEVYYWFNLKIKSDINKKNHKPALVTRKIFKKVNSGSFNKYAESFTNNLKKNKIAVGPYNRLELAKDAQKYYQLSGLVNYEEADKFINSYPTDSSTYFCYFTHISFNDNKGSLLFKRIPARIAICSKKEFLLLLYEGLSFQLFAIGPFNNQLDAEKSKYIFRKYGEIKSEGPENKNKVSNELLKMADNWKNLKISTEKQDAADNTDVNLMVKIEFPPNYIAKNAIQYIEVQVVDKNNKTTKLAGNTLQGEEVQDNNKVISFENGGIEEFHFKLKQAEINTQKVVLKSALFSYTETMDCEDIFLEFKE